MFSSFTSCRRHKILNQSKERLRYHNPVLTNHKPYLIMWPLHEIFARFSLIMYNLSVLTPIFCYRPWICIGSHSGLVQLWDFEKKYVVFLASNVILFNRSHRLDIHGTTRHSQLLTIASKAT